MVDRLLGLGFVDSQIERTVQELGFRMTLETALDWLCLNIPTVELPALFTDADLRDSFTTVTTADSLTVLTFDKPSIADRDGRPFERSVASQPPTTFIQTPIVDSDLEEAEQNETKTKKALLLDRFQYVEAVVDGNEEDEHHSSGEKGEPPTTTTPTSAGVVLQSPQERALTQQELELAQRESELHEMQLELQAMKDDLHNEANNYLRSKQEIKQLGIETRQFGVAVTKKQRIVEGLRRKLNQTKPVPPPQKDQRVDNSKEDDEDEQCGVLDLFGGDQNEEDEDAQPFNAASNPPEIVTEPAGAQPSESRIDATIGIDWTGKTPQMILEDLCRKKKVSRPKLTKLSYGQGYSLAVVVQTSKKSKEMSTLVAHVRDFVPNSSIPDYLAAKALYELEPTMPLYHILPPSFRSLWLSWLQEVEVTKNQAVSDQKKVKHDRVQYLLSLISSSSSNDRIEEVDYYDHQEYEVDHKDIEHGPCNEGHRHDPDDHAKSDKLREHFTRRMATKAYQEMLRIRHGLPMASYKDDILETVRSSRVTIISAQTGAGKTTQCPQFLLEEALLEGRANQTQILVTQPRRVAATSVAERVSEEICEPRLGGLVGYQIRMEAVRSAGTKLLFCTTGIVLRRLQDDRTLRGVVCFCRSCRGSLVFVEPYSSQQPVSFFCCFFLLLLQTHVIVDEVHERQQQTDVLLIALRELLGTTRPDLKVILVSIHYSMEVVATPRLFVTSSCHDSCAL
jgi:ATP-dependent RNA helicase DHX29